jgi:segregation and condensation protein B
MPSSSEQSQVEDGIKPQPDGSLSLVSRLEALLFVADEPTPIRQLAVALELDEQDVDAALQQLAGLCQARGLRLQRDDRRVQFVTAPEAAADVQRFLGLEDSATLSAAALEALALVAYHQPVTRAQIDAVRGVSSDSVLRTLLARGLIEARGRLNQAGRPIVYGTTFEFLQHFGLADIQELPEWSEMASLRKGEPNDPGRQEDQLTAP